MLENRINYKKDFLRLIVLTLFNTLIFLSPAWGDLSMGIAPERFDWQEFSGGQTVVHEGGLRYSLRLNWTQDRQDRVFFGYGGKLYLGTVNYDGYNLASGAPATTTTTYSGFQNEGRFTIRFPLSGLFLLDVTTGLGWDHWSRMIESQIEDYDIVYLKMGPRFSQKGEKGLWFAMGGKYPLYTLENAHLTDIGFDRNPPLHPGSQLSLYANLGYRFNPLLEIVIDYDSYRFSESQREAVNWFGRPAFVYQPASNMEIYGLQLIIHFQPRVQERQSPAIDSSTRDEIKLNIF